MAFRDIDTVGASENLIQIPLAKNKRRSGKPAAAYQSVF